MESDASGAGRGRDTGDVFPSQNASTSTQGILRSSARRAGISRQQAVVIQVGGQSQRFDADGGHFFQPDRLPDAGDGGVPDAPGLKHLLAALLQAGIGWIGTETTSSFSSVDQRSGDIQGKRQVTTAVGPHGHAVDPHLALMIYRAEME